MKRKLLICFIAVFLIAGISVSAYVAFGNRQGENVPQTDEETGAELPQEEANGDFNYTKFEDNGNMISSNENDSIEHSENGENAETLIPGEREKITDPKASIYNKMLNTIDFFNALHLTMETSMIGDEILTIEYDMNLNKEQSYQKMSSGGSTMNEVYSENGDMIYVYYSNKTYAIEPGTAYSRDDAPYIPLSKRIVPEADGMPCYYYRNNITNCPYALYSVFPQELAFSYLKDFDTWEIVDSSVDYLNRDCVMIEGVPCSDISRRHKVDRFTMVVDSQTGILMKFVGTNNGEVSRYTTVTDMSQESQSEVKRFNAEEYDSFSEVAGRPIIR